ncbi:uncharacterized protein LOC135826118 [Sycon ciliatum]|uniref:uncharacterized protein LOC135826118 n=1 Tax=Sycon ciliatum TaxID=27933 RepID=UPI0031F64386
MLPQQHQPTQRQRYDQEENGQHQQHQQHHLHPQQHQQQPRQQQGQQHQQHQQQHQRQQQQQPRQQQQQQQGQQPQHQRGQQQGQQQGQRQGQPTTASDQNHAVPGSAHFGQRPCEWIGSEEAINTVFLPRHLPDYRAESTEDPLKCNYGESQVLSAFADINADILPAKTTRMLYAWNDSFRPSTDQLDRTWQNLAVNERLPVYLPAQNAALTFAVLEDNLVEVSGYDIQAAAKTVVSAKGPLLTEQPRLSIVLPKEHAFSRTMAEQICCLQRHVFPDAMATTERRHTVLKENREVISSKYVFEWLFSAMVALQESDTPDSTVVAVQKKVRDVVTFPRSHDSSMLPWRRNPTWFAVKYILHATLVKDCGFVTGTVLYKTAMLRFMTQFLLSNSPPGSSKGHNSKAKDSSNNSSRSGSGASSHGNSISGSGASSHSNHGSSSISTDLLHQMLCKVSNRIHKLSCLLETADLPDGMLEMCLRQISVSMTTVTNISSTLRVDWKKHCASLESTAKLDTIAAAPVDEQSTVLSLSASRARISRLLGGNTPKVDIIRGAMDQHGDGSDLSMAGISSPEGSHIGLHAFEEQILRRWQQRKLQPMSTADCLRKMMSYTSATAKIYDKPDAIAQSRRLLVASVLMAMCDMSATSDHPLLLQHGTDVNMEPLRNILTTTPLEMEILHEVEAYYGDRSLNATQNTGPLQPGVTSNSLSVQYFNTQREMKERLEQLIVQDELKEEVHRTAVQNALEKMSEDERRHSRMSCQHEYEWNSDYTVQTENHYYWRCNKCTLDRELDGRTHQIFERLLPPEQPYRKAAVFELCIPSNISSWRDCTLVFNEHFLLSVSFKKDTPSSKREWVERLSGSSAKGKVTLGSTNVPFLNAHYSSKGLRNEHWQEFVKPCNMNCTLAKDSKVMQVPYCHNDDIRKTCTLDHSNGQLQQYIDVTTHQQSDVIAKQNVCPEFFSLREFITFGSVRAGQRLQWYNILRGIHQRTLLLHRVQVVQLIAQSVWQAESNEEQTILRDAHHPCQDTAFVAEFSLELRTVLGSVKGNWANYWSLCSVVLLANRLLSLYLTHARAGPEQTTISALYTILAECRQEAVIWLDKIRALMEQVEDDSAGNLQEAAAHIATFGTLTYQHSVDLDGHDARALFNWLKFVTDLHANTVLNQSRAQGFLDHLTKQTLRIAFNNHSSFIAIIKDRMNSEGRNPEFENFISDFYMPGISALSYRIHDEDQLWISCKWKHGHEEEFVQFDLREGKCWINGLPPGRLSTDITRSELFSRHFKATVFVVMSCTSPQGQIAQATGALAACSVDNIGNDSSPEQVGPFLFARHNRLGRKQLCVYECRADGRELLLLDPSWFSDGNAFDLPALMVDEHSFWLDIHTHKIYLRPVYFRDKNFADVDRCEYILKFSNGRLCVCEGASVGVSPASTLLSLTSSVGESVLEVMLRIELAKYIEIWLDVEGTVRVRLPRLGLSFFICNEADGSVVFKSGDYIGWSVDSDQSLGGTLLGLSTGLVLVSNKSEKSEQRCLLLPHGLPVYGSAADESTNQHAIVKIQLEKLYEPRMFRFAIRPDLQQLKAPDSRCAWFYLSLLHAMTSFVQPDPFTEMTGMEMAILILQSARCWSCDPLDDTSLLWLYHTAQLSPSRHYYPEHMEVMQTVQWPAHLPSYCASDAYILLVDKIISNSKTVSFLHTQGTSEARDKLLKSIDHLSKRPLNKMSYTWSRNNLPLLARLQEDKDVACASPTPAFDHVPALHKETWETTWRLVTRSGAAMAFTADIIDEELRTRADSCMDGEQKKFRKGIERLFLLTCKSWSGIDLCSDFIALHEHIDSCKETVAERIRLALMFSLWTYEGKQSRLSLLILAALANSRETTEPPGLRQFPSPHAVQPPASHVFTAKIKSFEDFCSSRGLDKPSAHASSVTVRSYQERRSQLEQRYDSDKATLNGCISQDVVFAGNLLSNGPYFDTYHKTSSASLPMVFQVSQEHLFKRGYEYRNDFAARLTHANSSKVLQRYAELMSASVQVMEVTTPPAVLDRLEPDSQERHQDYCRLLSITMPPAPHSQDRSSSSTGEAPGPVAIKQNQQPHRDGANELREVERLREQLQTPQQTSGGQRNPIIDDFSHDLKMSLQDLRHHPLPKVEASGKRDNDQFFFQSLRHKEKLHDKTRKQVQRAVDSSYARLDSQKAMHSCGLLLRCLPLALLPHLLSKVPTVQGLLNITIDQVTRKCIVHWAVDMVNVLRWSRLIRLHKNDQLDMLQRELSNEPHANWAPLHHVEWLLFELENDACIWKRQVDVAVQMMNPSSCLGMEQQDHQGEQLYEQQQQQQQQQQRQQQHHDDVKLEEKAQNQLHAVMQLNMGEGKTSVILPIIAAELADSESLVRIIVLTSLHNTNINQLVFKLGGLLNHRVYSLPFRRDIPLSEGDAGRLRDFLQVARQRRDVMVTVREHLLSLQIKHQEACFKRNTQLARILSNLMNDLHVYARDIIDEADEVLHHRFQLIYPLGDSSPPDGKELRWDVAELVLEAVKVCMPAIKDRFKEAVTYTSKQAHEFPFVRVHDSPEQDPLYKALCEALVDYIFSGRGRLTKPDFMNALTKATPEQREQLKQLLQTHNLSKIGADMFRSMPDKMTLTMLILRGLLASGVLLLALKKRYRVEYGLMSTTQRAVSSSSSSSSGGNNSGSGSSDSSSGNSSGNSGSNRPSGSSGSSGSGGSESSSGSSSSNSNPVVNRLIRMAVPFRAKDVAAERTEFGHPDVAIVLTLLSYYQHGLTDGQINTVLDKLDHRAAKKEIYNSWVNVADGNSVDESIREFDSINRQDPLQMNNLVYPFLRYHMDAINFFVNLTIFPSEAKEFPRKLIANGWSMTSSSRERCVTGFSGTNDTRHLLPGSTKQQDLPQLKHTNAYVCSLLLRKCNNRYNVLPEDCNGRALLTAITETSSGRRPATTTPPLATATASTTVISPNEASSANATGTVQPRAAEDVRRREDTAMKAGLSPTAATTAAAAAAAEPEGMVTGALKIKSPQKSRAVKAGPINTIIDAGAVVLDLSNEEFAKQWLKQRTDKEAVIYFDTANQLRVLDRRSHSACKLELSPYASNLSECLVYLDHAHCRGTDLQMVDETRAAVTLGKNLRRDEFVQACMRMRRLRSTHSVSFWAPPEIDRQIRQLCMLSPAYDVEHKHVVQWCFHNSISATEDSFYSWASQGLAHLHTENALEPCRAADVSDDVIRKTGKECSLQDRLELCEMYGQVRSLQSVADIVEQRGKSLQGAREIVKRCTQLVPHQRRYAQELDEEQERELEQEIEEERERELPPPKKPVKEFLLPYLKIMAVHGRLVSQLGHNDLTPVWRCFEGTQLPLTKFQSAVSSRLWNCNAHLHATHSFRRTVEDADVLSNMDDFLRPVEWVLLVNHPESATIILISPFQANELSKIHRKNPGNWSRSSSLLMYASLGNKMQSIMSDWRCTLAGEALSPLPRLPVSQRRLFGEILCFSGGLFLGRDRAEMLANMSAIADVFSLSPAPDSGSKETVRHIKSERKLGGDVVDPLEFLRHVMSALRSAESLERSEMGMLVLRSAWPALPEIDLCRQSLR